MEGVLDVVIVGAGPAGCAAALQLARREPSLAARTLLLDAAVFPREKLCAGCLVPRTDALLARLEVPPAVPAVELRAIHVHYEGGSSRRAAPRPFRVVRRPLFDASLLRQVKKRGVAVREGTPVLDVVRDGSRLRLETPAGPLRARVLIGADGARSLVRTLVGPARGERMMALEVLTPDPAPSDHAVFDFRPAARGLRGYAWDLPCVVAGERFVSRGLAATHWPADVPLRDLFRDVLRQRAVALEHFPLEGGSTPLYHPESPQGAAGVVLAGDAVGADPWLGEGLSVALATGILAADATADGLARGELDFADFGARIRESAVGRRMQRSLARADGFFEAAARAGGLDGYFGGGVR